MSHDDRFTANNQPIQDGEATALLETAIALLQHDKPLDAEKVLRRIVTGQYRSSWATNICSQALDHLIEQYRRRGAYERIVECCHIFLQRYPNHANAHCFLGDAYRVLGKNELGLQHCLRALELDPNHAAAHLDAGILLGRKEEFQRAAHHFEKGIALRPEEREAYINLGKLAFVHTAYLQNGIEALKRAIALAPDNADPYFMLAKLFEMSSRLTEAEHYLKLGLSLAPEHPHSHRLYANILRRLGRITEAIARLEAFQIPPNDPALGIAVHFELGRLYEREQNSARAYSHYLRGNQLQSQSPQGLRMDKQAYLNTIRKIHQTFTRDWLSTWSAPYETSDDTETDPIFLVGFPRSGTTLLDQILSSHPSIQVIEEQPMLANIVDDLGMKSSYPAVLANLDDIHIHELRQKYFSDAAQYLEAGKGDTFVDKLPLNIIHIGLIERLFPGARIILALRHPCDACLSCFMQSFGYNDAMANFHTVEDAAKLYAEAMGLWRHYADLLPLNYHRIKYEDVTNDLEEETRKLFEFLGIGWDPCVLKYNEYAKKRERINTPSYEQVTEKIYSRARYRWQRYQAQLQPVLPALTPLIKYFDY